MRSGIESSQFLRIFLPTLDYMNFVTEKYNTGKMVNKQDSCQSAHPRSWLGNLQKK